MLLPPTHPPGNGHAQVPQQQVDAAAVELVRARSAAQAAEQRLEQLQQAMELQAKDLEEAQAAAAAAKARALDLQVCGTRRRCLGSLCVFVVNL